MKEKSINFLWITFCICFPIIVLRISFIYTPRLLFYLLLIAFIIMGLLYGLGVFIMMGFSGKYDMDFLLTISNWITYFGKRGYEATKALRPGASNPGVVMTDKYGNQVTIVLHFHVWRPWTSYDIIYYDSRTLHRYLWNFQKFPDMVKLNSFFGPVTNPDYEFDFMKLFYELT